MGEIRFSIGQLVGGEGQIESPFIGEPTEELERRAKRAERAVRIDETLLRGRFQREPPEQRQVRPGIGQRILQAITFPGRKLRETIFGEESFIPIAEEALGVTPETPSFNIPLPYVPPVPTGQGTELVPQLFGGPKEVPIDAPPSPSLAEQFAPEELGERLATGKGILPPELKRPAAAVVGGIMDTIFDPLTYAGFGSLTPGGRAAVTFMPKGPFTAIGRAVPLIKGERALKAGAKAAETFGRTQVGRAMGKAFIPGFGLPPGYRLLKEDVKRTLLRSKLQLDSVVDEMFSTLNPSELKFTSIAVENPELLQPARWIAGREAAPLVNVLRQKGASPQVISQLKGEINLNEVNLARVQQAVSNYTRFRLRYTNDLIEAGLLEPAETRLLPRTTRERGGFPIIDKRKFESIVDALNTGELPELDLARLTRRYGVAAESMLAKKSLLDRALSQFGTKVDGETIQNFRHLLDDGTHIVFKGHVIPREIANDIRKVDRVFTSEEAAGSFLRFWDRAQQYWKANVTVTTPGFHIRNSVGNAFNSWLAGMNNPLRYQQAVGVIAGRAGSFAGRSNQEILEAAVELGVYKPEGAFVGELTGLTAKEVKEAASVGQLANPFSSRFAPVELGRVAGSSVENNARVALFLDRLSKGDGPEKAAQVVKKYLFDYSELTTFEQDVLKRVIPFYTWIRKNTALQAEHIITTPGKYSTVSHLLGLDPAIQEKRLPFEERPRYMRESPTATSVALPGVRIEGLPTVAQVDIPIQELEFEALSGRTLSPIIQAASDVISFARSKVEKEEVSKVPLPAIYRQMAGALPKGIKKAIGVKDIESFITGKPVPGVDPRVKRILGHIFPVITKLSRLIPTEEALADPRFVGGVTGTLTGLRVEPIDVRRQRALTKLSRRRQMEEHLNRLFREGEVDAVQFGFGRRLLRR